MFSHRQENTLSLACFHFPSKEAVLRAGVEQYILEAQRARAMLGGLDLPPGEALEWIGRRTLEIVGGKTAELRILWRDLDRFTGLKGTPVD